MITVTTKRGISKFVGAVYLTYVVEGYLIVYTMQDSLKEVGKMEEHAFFIEEVISVKGHDI